MDNKDYTSDDFLFRDLEAIEEPDNIHYVATEQAAEVNQYTYTEQPADNSQSTYTEQPADNSQYTYTEQPADNSQYTYTEQPVDNSQYTYTEQSADNNQYAYTGQTDEQNQFVFTQPVEEAGYDEQTYQNATYAPTPEEEKTPLGLVSFFLLVGCMILPIGASILNIRALMGVVEGFCSLMGFASFVIMIITRVKYPKDVWGKVTMWLYIIGTVLVVISAVILIVACISCAKGL